VQVRLFAWRAVLAGAAGGQAAESALVSVTKERKNKKGRGAATPSDDTRKGRPEGRPFWSPADLAGVGK
jgi:hypothetical protein